MKSFLVLVIAVLAGVNVFAQTAVTQTISTGFNRASSVFYGNNSFDDYWDVIVTPIGSSADTASASVVNEPTYGLFADPLLVTGKVAEIAPPCPSKWISYSANGMADPGMETSSTYSTTFTLSGTISNYSLHLEYTQNNLSTSVLLNGQSILSYCTSPEGCENEHNEPINIIDVPPCSDKLQDGVNTLVFVVEDVPAVIYGRSTLGLDRTTGLRVCGTISTNTVINTALTVLPQEPCVGTQLAFTLNPTPASVTWNFGDGITSGTGAHAYTSPGAYTVTATYSVGACEASSSTVVVNILECTVLGCKDCIGSFAPIPGEEYVLSAWVREDGAENLTSYQYPAIDLSFVGSTVSYTGFQGKGQIIDGWQRIEEKFTIPLTANKINIDLRNLNAADPLVNVYFDDIRIHPFKANMKSFVYDPVTLRLAAELDANNYATFYEYDEDGALVRVKKETEKGISTIKETRNNNKK